MATIHLNSLTKRVTLEVRIKITRQFRFRIWLAVRLVRLTAWVLGCNVRVICETNDDETEFLYKNE